MPHFPHPIRFVSTTDDGYSIYRRTDGDRAFVYVQDETGRILRPFSDVNLRVEWALSGMHSRSWAWTDELAETLIDPDEVESITFCDDCSQPTHEDETTYIVRDDRRVCDEDCLSSYGKCDWCMEYENHDDMREADGEETICSRCRDYSAYYCDYCEVYYHQHSDSHYHEGGCGCESPATRFTVPDGSGGTISQNERLELSLPEGYISDEGIGQIANVLRSIVSPPDGDWYVRDEDGQPVMGDDDYRARTGNYYRMKPEHEDVQKWTRLSYDFADEIGNEWQTDRGNYTRRLRRLAHQRGLTLPNDAMTKIGNIARANSGGSDVSIEVTRDLNMSAEDFYHEDSCWWTEYSGSRCALKSNGGYGIRTFGGMYDYVQGRVWVMPVKRRNLDWIPTFDTMEADGYLVFNGYGDLDSISAARIVSTMYGMTYKRVNFYQDPMYVNADFAYLITSKDLAEGVENVRLHISEHSDLYSRERSLVAA